MIKFPIHLLSSIHCLLTLAVILLRRWRSHGVLRRGTILASIFYAQLCLWCNVIERVELVFCNKTIFVIKYSF
jgi:hypothetical protein